MTLEIRPLDDDVCLPLAKIVPKKCLWNDHVITYFCQEEEGRMSRAFTIPGTQTTPTFIGWMNGICNSFADAKNSGSYLQRLSDGHTITGIYNQTHTGLIAIAEAAFNHYGYLTLAAKLLQHEWNHFHTKNAENPNLKLLHVCHSQAAIHAKNALAGLPQQVRDRVIVLAIAPAAIIPKSFCFQAYNYASEKDVVYKFEPTPIALEAGTIDDVIVPRIGEALSHRQELIILPAHPDAKGIDHGIQSLTYKPIIEAIFKIYRERNGIYLPNEK